MNEHIHREKITWKNICEASQILIEKLTIKTDFGWRTRLGLRAEPTLLSTAFGILLRYSLRLPNDKRLEESLLFSQASGSGHFIDPLLECATELGIEKRKFLQRQTDYFSSLALLAANRTFHQIHLTRPSLDSSPECWLEALDWSNPWDCGNEIMFALHFAGLAKGKGQKKALSWSSRVLDWLLANQDPETGFLPKGHVPELTLSAMCGAVHWYPFFLQQNPRTYPLRCRIICATVRLQNADGNFYPISGGGACPDYDGVATLWWLQKKGDDLTPFQLIEKALYENINAEALFCEARRKNVTPILGKVDSRLIPWFTNHVHYYSGWNKMAYEIQEPTIWAQWFRCISLAMVQLALGKRPPVRFLPWPGLGWAPDESLTFPIEGNFND